MAILVHSSRMGEKLEEFRTVEHVRLDGNVRELNCPSIQKDS